MQANESRFPLFINNCLPTQTAYRPNYILSQTREVAVCSLFTQKFKGEANGVETSKFLKQYGNVFTNDCSDNILYYSSSYSIKVAVIKTVVFECTESLV
jgi:hypothetical protein